MASEVYRVPDLADGQFHRIEQTIKRSRFITSIAHADSPEAAKRFVQKIKDEFPDARHNCWAFCAGAAGSSSQIGASDDGEPHGTAGRPMLTVLMHCGVGEITAVVTRYFGGILLGTGGLVKAYQSSVKLGLENLPLCDRMIASEVSVGLGHRFVTPLLRMLPDYRASVVEQRFEAEAFFKIKLPEDRIEKFFKALEEVTSNSASVKKL